MSPGNTPPHGGPKDSRTVTIVRYPNRRFYDRSQARYVTLQEIEAMVREGKTVTILEQKTQEEITGRVLIQLILERYPERMDLVPVPVLHLILRANNIVLGLLREYFQQSLKYLEFWQRLGGFSPMGWMQAFLPGAPPAGAPEAPPGGASQAGEEILAGRIAELERRLSTLNSRSRKRQKKRRQ